MNRTGGKSGRRNRILRLLARGAELALSVLVPLAGAPQAGEAQMAVDGASPWRIGVGAGWSQYSLVSRFDSGTLVSASGSYDPTPRIRLEAAVRGMRCPDCTRFLLAEGILQFRHPRGVWTPYVAGGVGVTSDPDFVGTRQHFLAGLGTTLEWIERPWGLQFEARGRRLDPGQSMVEVALGLTYRIPNPRSASSADVHH